MKTKTVAIVVKPVLCKIVVDGEINAKNSKYGINVLVLCGKMNISKRAPNQEFT